MQDNKPHILYIGNKLAIHGRTPTGIDNLGPVLELEGYNLYYSSSQTLKLIRLIDMLLSIWKYRKKADVVFIDTFSTTAFYFAWLCGWWCKVLKIKYAPILHGGNLPERFKQSPQKCKQLFGNSYVNVAVSSYLKKHLKDAGYESVLIENHIEVKNYQFRLRSSVSPKLLWVRAFHETYNPQMAVQLMMLLVREHPAAKLTMVGPELDGSMKACKELARKYQLDKNITFTGKLSKKEWTVLAEDADIFINTTKSDNQPVSVIEAMALGIPIISTNVGGIPYLIENGVNGKLVNVGDTHAMMNAVEELMQDKNLTEQFSTNGRKLAETFDWEIIKQKWKQLLSKL